MNYTPYALNQVNLAYDSLEDAFPEVDPGVEPLGSRVLVQLRRPKKKTRSGLLLPDETQDTETWNTQVAKVVATGPVAFRNRGTLEQWKEGDWVLPGDYVRVPKYGGDRWSVTHKDGDDACEILFILFNDLDLLGRVSDPLTMKAYI